MKSGSLLSAVAMLSTATNTLSAQVIHEDIKLHNNIPTANAHLGNSIAMSNGLVAVGAEGLSNFAGAAYLFDTSTGEQLVRFIANIRGPQDLFGCSIALDSKVCAIGSSGDDDLGPTSGSTYIFDADPSSPTFGDQLIKLTASDGRFSDQFGYAVALDNGILAVCARYNASGTVYLYDANPESPEFGSELTQITGEDEPNSNFGWHMDMDDDTLVVLDNTYGYIIDANPDSLAFGTILTLLTDNDGPPAMEMIQPQSIAIDNNIIAVGLPQSYPNPNNNSSHYGSIQIFDASTGRRTNEIVGTAPFVSENLGMSVALENNHLIAGCISSRVFHFDLSEKNQIVKLEESGDGVDVFFGREDLDIENGIVTIGSSWDDEIAQSSGAAFIFHINADCLSDINDDGLLNFFDISAFITALGSHDPIADFTNDGLFNFFDISAFLNAFTAGCP